MIEYDGVVYFDRGDTENTQRDYSKDHSLTVATIAAVQEVRIDTLAKEPGVLAIRKPYLCFRLNSKPKGRFKHRECRCV